MADQTNEHPPNAPAPKVQTRRMAWRHNAVWLAVAGAVVLLAFALRAYGLSAQSVWFDEGWSWHLAKLPLAEMARVTAADRSPALYYVLLHAWVGLAGESEFALRFLSVCADVITVALLVAFGRALARSAVPVAALLYALCPFALWYAQETRMYALVAALCVASCYWLWRWLQAPTRLRLLVISALTLALAAHTHYYAVFLLAGQWMAVLLGFDTQPHMPRRPRARFYVQWLLAAFGVGAALLPWLLFASAGFAYDDGFVFPLNTVLGRMGEWVMVFASGGQGWPLPPWGIVALAVAVLAGAAGFLLARRWSALLVLTALVMGPLLAATLAVRLVYPYRSVFHPRYLIYVAPLATLLIAGVAGGAQRISFRRWRAMALRAVSVAAMLLLWLPGLVWNYANPALARDDVRGAIKHVVEALQPRDVVIMTRDNYAVQYYLHTTYPQQAGSFIALPPGLHGILRSDAEVVHALAQRDPNQVRLLLWQDEVVDPQKLMESTLWGNGYEIGEYNFGPIRLPLYRISQHPMQALPMQPIQATFGNQLDLIGYWVRAQGKAGDWFYAVLLWQPRQKLNVNYKVFVHALDANGLVVFQQDKLALSELLPTTSWAAGEALRDAYAMVIPAALPAGDYRIVVGVYDPATPDQPLPVSSASQAVVDNAILLGQLQVQPR
jgi:4-amino-4-deoxy-L-arabinose transferase-like glycosyltransferase